MTKRPYYTLLERLPGEEWCIHFGDYDRATVEQEKADSIGHHAYQKGTKFKIIKTIDQQSSIDCAVKLENELLKVEKQDDC
jgi:hypothetical protein